MRATLFSLAVAAIPAGALAQSNVSSPQRHAWMENAGWTLWRHADSGGVKMNPRFLSGVVWSESLGWINLGNGIVGPCGEYSPAATQTGASFGVNLTRDPSDPQGRRVLLSGYAWSENGGWINFGAGALALPAQPAFIDTAGSGLSSGRIRGFAWSESRGWINFDLPDAGMHVAFCYANCDGSEGSPTLTANDFQCFINAYAGGDAYANCDASTGTPCLTANDFQCFLNHFASGCS